VWKGNTTALFSVRLANVGFVYAPQPREHRFVPKSIVSPTVFMFALRIIISYRFSNFTGKSKFPHPCKPIVDNHSETNIDNHIPTSRGLLLHNLIGRHGIRMSGTRSPLPVFSFLPQSVFFL